jgi:hypothetical protein
MFRSFLKMAVPALLCLVASAQESHAQRLVDPFEFFFWDSMTADSEKYDRHATGGLPTPKQVMLDMRPESIGEVYSYRGDWWGIGRRSAASDRRLGIKTDYVRRPPPAATDYYYPYYPTQGYANPGFPTLGELWKCDLQWAEWYERQDPSKPTENVPWQSIPWHSGPWRNGPWGHEPYTGGSYYGTSDNSPNPYGW